MKKVVFFGLLFLIAVLFFSCEDPCGIVEYVVECIPEDGAEEEEIHMHISYFPPGLLESKTEVVYSTYWSKSFSGCSGDHVYISVPNDIHMDDVSEVTVTLYFKGKIFKQTSEPKSYILTLGTHYVIDGELP